MKTRSKDAKPLIPAPENNIPEKKPIRSSRFIKKKKKIKPVWFASDEDFKKKNAEKEKFTKINPIIFDENRTKNVYKKPKTLYVYNRKGKVRTWQYKGQNLYKPINFDEIKNYEEVYAPSGTMKDLRIKKRALRKKKEKKDKVPIMRSIDDRKVTLLSLDKIYERYNLPNYHNVYVYDIHGKKPAKHMIKDVLKNWSLDNNLSYYVPYGPELPRLKTKKKTETGGDSEPNLLTFSNIKKKFNKFMEYAKNKMGKNQDDKDKLQLIKKKGMGREMYEKLNNLVEKDVLQLSVGAKLISMYKRKQKPDVNDFILANNILNMYNNSYNFEEVGSKKKREKFMEHFNKIPIYIRK